MNRVLLVEDDEMLQQSLRDCLKMEGFEVLIASTLVQSSLHKEGFDVVILDWMLPDGQGIEFLKELRSRGNLVPVIMLTARNELVDKVLGLELGANDYVTKPFEPRELVARIRVQLRLKAPKESKKEDSSIQIGGISLNPVTMDVFWKQQPVQLTKMEYLLLKLFLENPAQVFSRDEILDMVWGLKYPTTRTVDMHVRQLRQKFDPDLFETVHGTGYRFRVKEA